jgi:hypothetical protein
MNRRTFLTTLAAGLLTIITSGCATRLSEVRAEGPAWTRPAPGEPLVFLRCVRTYLDDHYGGFWGRFGGTLFELDEEPAGVHHLVARLAINPSDVRFDLAAAATGPGQVDVTLRLPSFAVSYPQQMVESDVRTAGDACARPG